MTHETVEQMKRQINVKLENLMEEQSQKGSVWRLILKTLGLENLSLRRLIMELLGLEQLDDSIKDLKDDHES